MPAGAGCPITILEKLLKAITYMLDRSQIYYWKCDRAFAAQELNKTRPPENSDEISRSLHELINRTLDQGPYSIRPAGGQGNHLTYFAVNDERKLFLRLENGPEGDDYMEIETRVIKEVHATGVPVPGVYRVDVTRSEVPFAYQVLEFIDYPDLNRLYKEGNINLLHQAHAIGRYVARWQAVQPKGYGPFSVKYFRQYGKLSGFHDRYKDYFLLNFEKHLDFLERNAFLSSKEAEDIRWVVRDGEDYLELEQGCLVHKDLALWNILGLTDEIKAFIDWDDTVSGDPTDDLSLLGCFHSKDVVQAALEGYASIKDFPQDFFPRFYLHLLRNMIVKAVIRVMANYFKKSDDFFLIGTGKIGDSLERVTREKIFQALHMLKSQKEEIIL